MTKKHFYLMHIGNGLTWEFHPVLVPHELRIQPMRAYCNYDKLLFYTYPQGYHDVGSVAPS
jgi:hypothetical protein